MEAVVRQKHVKVLQKAFFCLARIGDDLVIETTKQAIVLRTLGQSQSAYAHFVFSSDFFETFLHSEENAFFKCKVNIKFCLSAFRAVGSVDKFILSLDGEEDVLIFEMLNKSGIKRTFRYAFEDQHNILQADFSRNACPNLVAADPHLLSRCLGSFYAQLEEITINASKDCLALSSYIDSQNEGLQGALRSKYSMDKLDFDDYDVQEHGHDITFCLREFKAILSFCEAVDQRLFMFFERGGKPILLTNSRHDMGQEQGEPMLFRAEVVMATLQDEDDEDLGASQQQQRQQQSQRQQSQRQMPRGDSRSTSSSSSFRHSQGGHSDDHSGYYGSQSAISTHSGATATTNSSSRYRHQQTPDLHGNFHRARPDQQQQQQRQHYQQPGRSSHAGSSSSSSSQLSGVSSYSFDFNASTPQTASTAARHRTHTSMEGEGEGELSLSPEVHDKRRKLDHRHPSGPQHQLGSSNHDYYDDEEMPPTPF